MAIGMATGSLVAAPGQTVSLSALVSVTPDASDPQYLVVSGLDRDEYTSAATGSMGTLHGNGATTGFTNLGDDSYGTGIVFTYDASTGRYTNPAFGDLADVTLTASSDVTRNESISIFTTNNSTNLTQYANDPYALSQFTSLVGSVSVVTATAAPQPGQATPNSIVAAATSFIGQAWNRDGCWVLCSNISAKAGASLPLTSTSLGIPGVANGEWIVAYNGPAGQTGDWQSMVKAGEMVAFATSATSGHITTVVSGSGASAELVDNITYVNANGSIANPANDGSANDIAVATPHLASQEFAQAVAGSVVIYELDTPTVTAASGAPATVAIGSSTALSSLVTATDPGSRPVTEYEIYDNGTMGAAADTFLVNGVSEAAHTAATAITTTAASLASTFLQAAGSLGVDTLVVRAFNGQYWGDWESQNVAVLGAASSAPVTRSPSPVVAAQTADQVWRAGRSVDLALASDTFTDPRGLALTYEATQVGGRSLSWLTFDPTTRTFSGTSPSRAHGKATFEVTATDSAGMSTSEYFTAKIAASAAQFAQAVASVNATGGLAAFAPRDPSAHATHMLASPTARA